MPTKTAAPVPEDPLRHVMSTTGLTAGHAARVIADVRAYFDESVMFVGRVRGWPVAREAAQKPKELSYIHAEAYPASELKHGPLALIGPHLPTVAVVPDDELREKNLNTLGEIRARKGSCCSSGTACPIPGSPTTRS